MVDSCCVVAMYSTYSTIATTTTNNNNTILRLIYTALAHSITLSHCVCVPLVKSNINIYIYTKKKLGDHKCKLTPPTHESWTYKHQHDDVQYIYI